MDPDLFYLLEQAADMTKITLQVIVNVRYLNDKFK